MNFIKNIKWKNILICILCIFGMIILPSIISYFISAYIKNSMIITLISDFIYLIILFFIFYKDLCEEIKIFFSNIRNNFVKMFKWYFLGYVLMIVFNLIINFIMGDISDNENLVRSMIISYPLISFVLVSIFAPLIEEILFRKSVMKIFNNKWIGSIFCGILFGLAHVIGYLDNISHLIYMLPYAALGFTFAVMDYESKTVFSSVSYHSIHNTISYLLIIFLGAL